MCNIKNEGAWRIGKGPGFSSADMQIILW
jgi:hypothetical protein